MMTGADRIDEIRRRAFARDGGRPVSRALGPPSPSDETCRAKHRMRQAAYRVSLDRRKRPEAQVVGMALIRALASLTAFDPGSAAIVRTAIEDLVRRGYDRDEIAAVIKRVRKDEKERQTENGVDGTPSV